MFVFIVVALFAAPMVHAGEVARGDLAIAGLGLEVDRNPVITAIDVPSYVQTFFGGKVGTEAPPAPGLSALGDLTGPGIDAPITLSAIPGQKFAIPALHERGQYTLQNVRLTGAGGEFLQQAVPSFATIQVSDVLQTKVKVRQLTPEELRERGIHIDDRNFEVYEYTFIFGVDSQQVEIPYPVIIDKRTREIRPLTPGSFGLLPFPKLQKPPRFRPPEIVTFGLGLPDAFDHGDQKDREGKPGGVTLPAALVVPNGFGVLHQFFAVILQVGNNAPDGSNIRLDSITAKLASPLAMRVSKVMPAVSIGQPVPVVDERTGATFLVAGAQGSAEWTLEALKSGTHTLDIDVRATYQKPGQADFPLGGRVSTSLVVSDPRFHVNFSHPDVVRKDDKYTAFAFVTNLSAQRQHIFLDLSEIPACSSGSAANNVCRYEGSDRIELDIEPGEMVTVPHKLISRVTGKVYAAAGTSSDEAVGISIRLSMGVSQSGIPLSPATLVMPYHTQFLPIELVDANLQLLGLGYSLATAPLTKFTSTKPRVITTDVFRRAQQIALAGQRIFSTRRARDTNDPRENSDAFHHLALDLLGNVERLDMAELMPELAEWDELRRTEEAGRVAGAAMARQLEAGVAASAGGISTHAATPSQFVDDFAAATSHRTPFFLAYAHGANPGGSARPYALSVRGLTTLTSMDIPSEVTSGWVRGLAYGELTRFSAGADVGELAMVGRWSESLRVSVVPVQSSFTLHLLYPDTTASTTLRTDIEVTGATPGRVVTVDVARGSRTLIVRNGTATPLVNVVEQTPLRVLGAAQDMHLDSGGHLVSLLFNRPVTIADTLKLRNLLSLTINVAKAGYSATRRNNPSDPAAELQIPGAVLQDDRRLVLITFDKTLSTNATYEIAVERIGDLAKSGVDFSVSGIVPRIDNDRPASILTGKVLKGDNTPLPGTLVRMGTTEQWPERNGYYELIQYDVAGPDGRYLFEYIPRDLDAGLMGHYNLLAEAADGKQASLQGAVRLPGEVHNVNLVFLGRGSARGQVRWEDGQPIPNWEVHAGSTLFGGSFEAVTDANGNYEITGLPVGPLVFTIIDPDGAAVYATNSLRTALEVLTQDLIALRKIGPPPGVARVRVLVLRSDTMKPVAGAQVGFGSPDIPLSTGLTDLNGRFEFRRVPAGLMSIVAADFSISRHSAGVEVELRADQVLDQTLVLQIVPNEQYAFLEGVVTRDDPAQPSDLTRDQVVPNAIITIGTLPSVTANADGSYVFPDLPLNASDVRISVFDPQTSRRGSFKVPTLVAGSNRFPMRLRSLVTGTATARVRVTGGKGEPIAAASVFAPGYPPELYANKGGGAYEKGGLYVPQSDEVYAVTSDPTGPYGEQYARGAIRVDFPDQIGVTELRLPGLGTVVAKIEVAQPCSTPPCYAQAIGPVSMTYPVWDDYMQKVLPKTVVGDPDPATNLVTFRNVPVQRDISFATVRHPAGYAQQDVFLGYEGDIRNISLRLLTIGGVSGRVLAHDRITPIAGASVRITTGNAIYAPALTRQDGSFEFAAIPGNIDFTLVAEFQQDGIFRTGTVGGRTPPGGGPVSNLTIFMRQQSSIEGRVVHESDGTPVPLARYWLRELAWPYRSIGNSLDPLHADINGRFIVGNVFTGAFRISAVAPDNQEIRGHYQGELLEEGDVSQRDVRVRIGGAGIGSISITVVDPLLSFEPVPNAEVSLMRGNGRFDFTTTNDAGVAFFEDVPVGTDYSVFAFSKTRGRSGRSAGFSVNAGQTASASVQLDFLGVVSGTLTDPDTTPPNQPVRGEPISYQGSIDLRVTSGAAGEFEFLGVPEGPFQLQAWELSTQRIANGPPGLFISKLVPEQRNIQLEMERMGTLTVKVYLPNDTGGPGELAPLAEVTASQCTICHLYTPDYPYFRSVQGNPVVFSRMFRRVGYGLEVRELGGEGRTVHTGGAFPAGVITHQQSVVLPQSGTVEIIVVDDANQPVADAEVIINAYQQWRVFTSGDGRVTLPAVSFGWYSVTANKNASTVAAAGELKSRSQPLRLTLKIGSNVTLTVQGDVDAEQGIGQPSVGTRVILSANSPVLAEPLRLETRTDENGEFFFSGILVNSTSLSVLYIGPDDNTIGARANAGIPNGSTGTFTLPRVKLDATPPRVLAIDPPANSTNVSPSSPMTVTFSEPLAAAFLSRDWFELIATDDGAKVRSSVQGSVRPDGTYVVTVIPPPPPTGQTFPLKSNVLYRFAIRSGIQDLTGLSLPTTIGTSFTTVNYTEPAVVKIEPPESAPVPEQVMFRIKFNKPVDIASFDGSNGGVLTLERLDSYKGPAVETLPISRYLDVVDPTTIVLAPVGVAIAESSFYRIKVANVRDTQTPPNVQKDPRVFEFFSFDRVSPVVSIVSPVAAGEKLISGVLYSSGIAVTNEGSGTEASDVAYADWLDAAGVSIARVKTRPYAYSFVAPTTTSGTTFTLKATATDLSGNTSAETAFTWNVAPNEAPREIVVTNDVASVYPSGRVESRVRFKDEGVAVTVVLELRGTALDGSELRQILGSKNVTRASTAVEFPEAVFNWNSPLSLKDGTARVVATATDSVNHAGSGETVLTILFDQTKPVFVSFLPKAENRYKFGVNGTVTIELQTKDSETGIARAVFTVNGTTVLDATSGTFDPASGITTFRKDVAVPPKNADTRVPIAVTAYDQRGNSMSETREVIYERVDDSTLPVAVWITPLDGAALPSNQSGWQTTLRVQATDDVKVTAVRFTSSALAAPVELTAPKSGTTDVFEAKALLTMPGDGSSFTITATIADGDPAHDVELPITIDPVVAAPVITGDINITALTADQYANKSVLVRGGVRVYISVPLTLKDLMLVDGALLSIPEETKLDLTVTGRLFVDGDSRIDVSDKGYLGGLRTREDASFTNTSLSGRTLGGTTTGGATNADSSHAGLGGSFFGTTNATYGSIAEPVDFGSGGAAQPSGGSAPGANGGGVVILNTNRAVLAGDIHADSSSSGAYWRGGSGGSVNLRARTLITGARTRITANGSDQDANLDTDSGGGGGRIAIRVTERYEVEAGVLHARGGRNLGAEDAGYVGGGAGTILAQGRLLVSAFDERNPTTLHRSAGTPLAGALAFDAIEIGPRALARFDVTIPANVTAAATAMVLGPADLPTLSLGSTLPAAGADVPQHTSIFASSVAASASGVREVRTILSVQPSDVVAYPRFPVSIPSTASTIAVPSRSATGATSLKLRVTDRAGRVVESAPLAFNVVANTAPVIETFDVLPPTEIYAGGMINISGAARDDVAVKSLSLTSSAGTVTPQAPATPTTQTMTRQFSVSIPPATASNTSVVLTLAASDDFPGRAATTAAHSVLIRKDALAPSATIVQPSANQQFNEGTGATFVVEVNASDAEVGVQRVTATFEGVEHDLLVSSNRWTKTLSVPNVDGSEPVAKTIVIKAFDYDGNTATREVTIFVKPLVDPNAPKVQWACSSPGAMYPAGYEVTLRVSAIPAVPANGVDRVEITIGAGAPILATRVGTTDTYEVKYTIPAGTADGTLLDVRVLARSVAANEATLLGTITAVSGISITTSSTISGGDLAFENQSIIVATGGVLTVIGPHQLRNVVVLSGGKLLQKAADGLTAGALRVERLYVACGGNADVSGAGFIHNTTYPGSGVSDYGSGGSHIGRAGADHRSAGGAFGSVYEPKEAGGGGNTPNEAEGAGNGIGGGAIRIHGSGSIIVDGGVKANGFPARYGPGAGGSIWLSTPGVLGGAGTIEAKGSSAGTGSGGGAIVLEYGSSSGVYTVDARGGTSLFDGGKNAAAGTILRRVNGSADLLVDNKGIAISNTSATELPAFGRATVASVNGATVTLAERTWVSPSLAGNRVRVYAPDGAARGTYRIGAVTKHSATVTLEFTATVFTQDAVDYSGYLMYSPGGRAGRKYVAVRKNGAQWQFDDDTAFVNFTPQAGESLFASFTKTANRFRTFDMLRCGAACGTVDGLPVLEVVSGQAVTDTAEYNSPAGPNSAIALGDAGEIFLQADGMRRAFVLAGGAPSVTLESLGGGAVNVQPGDRLRGVYAFDSIKLASARVVSADLVESATAVQKDAASSLAGGNMSAPLIDPSKVSIAYGLSGPVIVGAAGAVSDPDAPFNVASRNGNHPAVDPPSFSVDNFIGVGTAGGLSVFHLENRFNGGGAHALRRMDGDGYLAFSPSQTSSNMQVGLAPQGTRSDYAEVGHYSFRLFSNATYEVWANAANANKNGTYAVGSEFRIEKTATSLRWFVDDVKVHEVTTGVPASLVLDLSFEQASTGELRSIEYGTAGPPRSFHAKVAADGSFRVPIRGAGGDPVYVRALDRHVDPFESQELLVGAVPADAGVASLSFSPAEVTGGRTATGTVTLLAPAGSQGALVELSSDNSVVTVPASITIPAGASSGTFTATTSPVLATVDANIRAIYGGVGPSSLLRVLKDLVAPAVTVTSPAPNSEYTEGQTAKIDVRATVTDQDSGVKRAWATFDGQSYTMALASGVWSAQIPVPFVEGSANVTKEIVVSAEDNTANVGSAAPVPVVIKPVIDNAPPTIAWSCLSSGAMFPVGHVLPLRVIAKAPNATNNLQRVEVTVNGVTSAATAKGNDVYEILHTVPDAADGSVVTVHAVAVTVSGSTASADSSFETVKGALEIKTNVTIAASDTSYDNRSVVVFSGFTATIDGTHTFQRLVVLGTVTHPVNASVGITATGGVFVACDGAIDASSRGYTNGATYPGEQASGNGTGGSHIGRGGFYIGPYGSTYGSVYRPQEKGAASGQSPSGAGGGVVRINASTVVIDGAVRANGAQNDRAGAGGSVWITTGRISGTGSIATNGGNAYHGIGGGGAISIEWTDPTSTLPALSSKTGTNYGENRPGGAGSIYVKGASSVYGDLTIDNGGSNKEPTILPSLGRGIAQSGTSGATLVTDRAVNIPAFYAGHWVEIYAPNGMLKGTWRIGAITGPKSVTLTTAGAETIDVVAGDTWQGVYRFDNVKAAGIRVESADPIRIGGTYTIEGSVETEQITATKLVIKGTLTHAVGQSLVIDAQEVIVESGGAIDVTGRGSTNGATYPGEQASGNGTGGSHIGRGGFYISPYGSTYGSVYRPQEKGAASGQSPSGAGGGVVRINATTVIIDGAVRANGAQNDRAGAGGSVWITTGRINGTGSIATNGGNAYHGIGGGGAISIESTDPTSTLPLLSSKTGTNYGESRYGGAGSIYVKGASSVYGDLTIDNGGINKEPTILPSLGRGLAQSGTSGATLVTDRTVNIQAYYAGHWVEIYAPNGTLKGTWRIGAITGLKSVTLASNSGETVDVVAGDTWQGVYRFDNVKASGIRVESADPIRIGGTYTIEGSVETEQITATKLVIKGTLTHAVGQSLVINAQEVSVESGGAIDVTGRGYTNGASYPGEQASGSGTGGSHIGRGGFYISPYGSTYGSVYRPQEKGAASGQSPSGAGGGVVRINATTVIIDGAVRANGAQNDRAGAGGSVWITTGRISGTGSIATNGGNAYHGIGGGGAISIESTDPMSTLPALSSKTGTNYGENRPGGAGSIYVKGASSVYGDLIIDNGGSNKEPTILPSLGRGIAQSGTSGATLVTDRAVNIPAFYAGHWVEIYAPNGTLKGTWRIGAITGPKSVTLTTAGGETIDVVAGDTWQGVYRFDNVKAAGIRVESIDPIRIGGTYTIEGAVETEKITAAKVLIKGTLTHATGQSLVIDAQEVRVETGGAIDVSSRGYTNGGTYPGEQSSGDGTGGSHIGRGGLYIGPYGSAYGSVYRPQEKGAASGNGPSGAGGGVVRINASTVVIDGAVRASGAQNDRAGAGGSVWITTGRISGTGSIATNGGNAYHGIGGGGAISIESTDPTSIVPLLSSRTGTNYGESRYGGAGSIYVKGAASLYGDLTIDNGPVSGTTILPSLGSGTALAGSSDATLVTDRAASIPAFFVGHWVRITDSGGTVRGTWRIATINVKTVTLAPNGAETISIAIGDAWRGVYRFDTFTTRRTTLISADPVEYTTLGSLVGEPSADAAGSSGSPTAGGSASPRGAVAALISLTLDPKAVSGIDTVQGLVTLNAEAPAGGALVFLSSSDPAHVLVPQTLLIPAGAMSSVFTIDTLPVAEVTEVTIVATWGAGRSAVLTLIPVSPIPVSPRYD